MRKYINADELKTQIENIAYTFIGRSDHKTLAAKLLNLYKNKVMTKIDEVSTADVEEVIYCKDCIFKTSHIIEGERQKLMNGKVWRVCKLTNHRVKSYDFCSAARTWHSCIKIRET